MTDAKNPEWFDDDAKVDSFIDRHHAKLIDKLGLGDLFADPEPGKPPGKPPPKQGAGGQVRSQEMEPAMSSLVTALTKGVELGASLGAASAKGGAPDKPAELKKPRVTKHWFFGETVEDDQ